MKWLPAWPLLFMNCSAVERTRFWTPACPVPAPTVRYNHPPRKLPPPLSQEELSIDDKVDFPAALASNWGWLMALGLLLVVGGLAAVASPFVASLFISTWIGIVAQLLHAIQARGWRGSLLHVVSGLVYTLGGGLVIFKPLAGLVALSFVVVATFIAAGIFRVWSGLALRPQKGWGWITAGGAVGPRWSGFRPCLLR